MYEVVIPRKVEKTLAEFSEKLRERLATAMRDLAENPRPSGYKKLEGSENYRIAVGDYRIIYDIADKIRIVTIVKIGHRKDVYKH